MKKKSIDTVSHTEDLDFKLAEHNFKKTYECEI